MGYILLDIGSSTIKCYRYTSKKLQCIKQVSIHFKKNFKDNKDKNISIDDKNTLISLLEEIKEEYPKDIIKTYATSVFRDISKKNKNELSEEIYLKTGIILNIIDQTTESIYLQIALLGKYKTKKNVLFINIGGGSTELIVVNNNKVIERKNVALGVGVINNKFVGINDSLSKVEINDVASFVKRRLPRLKSIVDIAFYTGGELKYMQLVRYPLKKNTLFRDINHPLVISFKDFQKKNLDVFTKITLKELEDLMLDNPTWMHGARACSALSQGVCEKYNIKTIIPSNTNLIDGVVRYEFGY